MCDEREPAAMSSGSVHPKRHRRMLFSFFLFYFQALTVLLRRQMRISIHFILPRAWTLIGCGWREDDDTSTMRFSHLSTILPVPSSFLVINGNGAVVTYSPPDVAWMFWKMIISEGSALSCNRRNVHSRTLRWKIFGCRSDVLFIHRMLFFNAIFGVVDCVPLRRSEIPSQRSEALSEGSIPPFWHLTMIPAMWVTVMLARYPH